MPEPLLTGKELIKRGFRAGRELGEILDRAYQAQLNGDFHTHDEAVEWLEKTHR